LLYSVNHQRDEIFHQPFAMTVLTIRPFQSQIDLFPLNGSLVRLNGSILVLNGSYDRRIPVCSYAV
jgi:hypothetical protein